VTSVNWLYFGSRCFYGVKILFTMRFKFCSLVLDVLLPNLNFAVFFGVVLASS
jgi:hypothetical protein